MRVNCPEYGKDSEMGSLAAHHQNHNGVKKGGPGQEGNREGGGENPREYRMAFLAKSGLMT